METLATAQLRGSIDESQTSQEETSGETGCGVHGIHGIDLARNRLRKGGTLRFTFSWPEAEKWEGKDFEIEVS